MRVGLVGGAVARTMAGAARLLIALLLLGSVRLLLALVGQGGAGADQLTTDPVSSQPDAARAALAAQPAAASTPLERYAQVVDRARQVTASARSPAPWAVSHTVNADGGPSASKTPVPGTPQSERHATMPRPGEWPAPEERRLQLAAAPAATPDQGPPQLGKPKALDLASDLAGVRVVWVRDLKESTQLKDPQLMSLLRGLEGLGFRNLVTYILPSDKGVVDPANEAAASSYIRQGEWGPGVAQAELGLYYTARALDMRVEGAGSSEPERLGIPPGDPVPPNLSDQQRDDMARAALPGRAQALAERVKQILDEDPDAKVVVDANQYLMGYGMSPGGVAMTTANERLVQLGVPAAASAVVQLRHWDDGGIDPDLGMLLAYSGVRPGPFSMQKSGYPRVADLFVAYPDPRTGGPRPESIPQSPHEAAAEHALDELLDNRNEQRRLESQPEPDQAELQRNREAREAINQRLDQLLQPLGPEGVD